MQCVSCKTPLPVGANYCPSCGAVAPNRSSNTPGSSLHTVEDTASSEAQQQEFLKTSQLPPLQEPLSNQHEKHNSSNTSLRVPPLFFARKPFSKTGMFIGSIVLVLILIGSGIFIFLTLRGNSAANKFPIIASTQRNPYPPYGGTLVINNSMSANNNGYYYWYNNVPGDNSGHDRCQFVNGAYHVDAMGRGDVTDCLVTGSFNNSFAYQVPMDIIDGDWGGITFLVTTNSQGYDKSYGFLVNQAGIYVLYVCNNSDCNHILSRGHISAFHSGHYQTNLIAVVVQGNNIDLYINLQKFGHLSDKTPNQGQVGVLAVDTSAPTEVVFRNAKVWKL